MINELSRPLFVHHQLHDLVIEVLRFDVVHHEPAINNHMSGELTAARRVAFDDQTRIQISAVDVLEAFMNAPDEYDSTSS